ACFSFCSKYLPGFSMSFNRLPSVKLSGGVFSFSISLLLKGKVCPSFTSSSVSACLSPSKAFQPNLFVLCIFLVKRSPATSAVISVSSRSEEHTSELQSRFDLVCRLLLEKKNH